MPTIEAPYAPWTALIAPPKGGMPTFEEVVFEVLATVSTYYVEEYAKYLEEKRLRGKKARWALKTRSYFRGYADEPDVEDLWLCAVAVARIVAECVDIGIGGRVHDPALLLAALMLKYAYKPLSFRELAKLLRRHGLSTGVRGEAYASKSTLHRAFHGVKPEAINLAIALLYLLIHAFWCYRLGGAVGHIQLYAADTFYVVLDGYATRIVKGVEKDVKEAVRATALVWVPESCVVAVVSSAKAASGWVELLPRGSLLTGDGEFDCRELLLACLANGVKVAIPGAASHRPVGLGVDMSKYWVRKLCEKVFGAAERRASTLRFRSAKAGGKAVLLVLAGHNLLRLWVSGRLFDAFEAL